ncbi:MAG: hypothetical protein ABSF91_15655 [Bacteroidota bacterium]|jgi:hypothetical protein
MTLETGNVFLLREFDRTGYDPHYRIVVHKTASQQLVLVYPSRQIEKVRNRCCRKSPPLPNGAVPPTYVEIPIGACDALPSLCAVDCNKAYIRSEADCINGDDFKPREGKLDPQYLAKIRYGIEHSDDVEEGVIDALSQ